MGNITISGIKYVFVFLPHVRGTPRVQQVMDMKTYIRRSHLTMHAGVVPTLCVFWPVVPEQAHHHLSCGKPRAQKKGLLTKMDECRRKAPTESAHKHLSHYCPLHNGYARPPHRFQSNPPPGALPRTTQSPSVSAGVNTRRFITF